MKLKVKDSKGKICRVADVCLTEDAENETEELSKADIKKLKRLIPHLDDLLQLLELEQQEHDKDFTDDEIEAAVNMEEEEEAKEETVEDDADVEVEEDDADELTQHIKPVNDSKKSFGAIEPRKVTDSVDTDIDRDNEVALAWAKRYNGGN